MAKAQAVKDMTISNLTQAIEDEKKEQWRVDGRSMLFDAKRVSTSTFVTFPQLFLPPEANLLHQNGHDSHVNCHLFRPDVAFGALCWPPREWQQEQNKAATVMPKYGIYAPSSCLRSVIVLFPSQNNVAMLLEINYRERLHMVTSEVKRRLDYQVAVQDLHRRMEKEHMVNWVEKSVVSSISSQQVRFFSSVRSHFSASSFRRWLLKGSFPGVFYASRRKTASPNASQI